MHVFKYPNSTREVSTIVPNFVEIGATLFLIDITDFQIFLGRSNQG
jgi:hypothetical protein